MARKAFLAVMAAFLAAPSSVSAVTVSRAQLSGSQLRVEGTAVAGGWVTVASSTHMASASADSGGGYRIESSSFRSDTCRVTVSDGGRTADAQATLSGCSPPSTTPPPGDAPPPPGSCTIVPGALGDGNVGTLNTWYFSTSGCRTSKRPVEFKVVAGRIPPGTRLFTQGVGSGGITGTPTSEGVFAFTVEARDQTGARDTESFSIRIDPPRPLVISNQSDALPSGTVGEFYCCGNLFADGGVSPYTWTLRSGQLPPGLQLQASPGRITGTPTTSGTFAFLMRVTDTRGAFAERTFSIAIG